MCVKSEEEGPGEKNNTFIADVRELKSKAQSGLSRRRCVSLSSEYPFLADITGKFVVRSDMSKTSSQNNVQVT